MINYKKYLIPVVIVIVTVVLYQTILANPPQAKRRGKDTSALMTVETITLQPQRYQIMVDSYGTVRPQTQSSLVAQISGQIRRINPNFREGGFFNKGDILLEIDDRDYVAEVKIAEASLLNAKRSLLEENARARQALQDWNRLGNGSTPGPLVLREPQVEAAKAAVLSAEATLTKAQLALERTQIIAPFNGRILNKSADVGQVVNSNSQLATIYATDVVEVRLPIRNSDLGLITLPEQQTATNRMTYTPDTDVQSSSTLKTVSDTLLSSDLIDDQQWRGRLIRTEGAIDSTTQQLFVVAEIPHPYDLNTHSAAVKIGQYVTARIEGKMIEQALIIPNRAIYQGSYVYVVDQQNLLKRRDIAFRWQNDQDTLISEGLQIGDRLVITPLGQVSSGTKVAIAGEAPVKKQRAGGERKKQRRADAGNTAQSNANRNSANRNSAKQNSTDQNNQN